METLAAVKNDQNVSVVKNAFNDFLNGNIAGILDVCTDDVVWSSYENSSIPYATSYEGKTGVAQFFSDLGTSVDYEDFQPREYFTDQDHVFVKGYHQAKVKSTGKTYGHDFLMEFRLNDGKVSSFFAYVDTRDQAEAFS